jgi:hypothetical protein
MKLIAIVLGGVVAAAGGTYGYFAYHGDCPFNSCCSHSTNCPPTSSPVGDTSQPEFVGLPCCCIGDASDAAASPALEAVVGSAAVMAKK